MATLLLGAPLLSAAGASTVGLIGAAGVFAPLAGSLLSGGLLSGALTAASAFSSVVSGFQQSSALNQQAAQAKLQARNERLQGREQALGIQDQLSRDLSSQNALFAARGGIQGEGSALAAQNVAKNIASQDIDAALFNSQISALNAEQRAANAKSNAKAAVFGGISGAISTIGGARSTTSFGGSSKASGGFIPIPVRKPSLLR
ncbi:hypothetical protein KAR91_30605 [Candidatus Pacearchaeota archaeon]|nr:hypothetical protein [Candidatus Pacearchaeota archaeon]